MANKNNLATINPENVSFPTFQGFVYEGYAPQNTQDYKTLIENIEHRTALNQTAEEQLANLSTTYGNIRNSLNQDKESLNWFNNFIQGYRKNIESLIAEGEYEKAIKESTRLGGLAAENPELKARIQTSEQYKKDIEEQKKRIASNEISEETYNWWLKNNPYTYKNIVNDEGVVIGGTAEKPLDVLYNDINYASVAQFAYNLITPDKSNVQRGTQTSYSNLTGHDITKGTNKYTAGEGSGSSWNKHDTREKVSIEDIKANIQNLISSLPGGYAQVEQAFNIAIDNYRNFVKEVEELKVKAYANLQDEALQQKLLNAQQQLDEREKFFKKNGSEINYQEYYARMITNNLFAAGLAHDWKTTSYTTTDNVDFRDTKATGPGTGTGTGTGSSNGKNTTKQRTSKGATVRQTSTDKGQTASNGVKNASNSIKNRFND